MEIEELEESWKIESFPMSGLLWPLITWVTFLRKNVNIFKDFTRPPLNSVMKNVEL